MTRDDATKIARRIMDRIEQERTIHLDSMVDEIVAGMALVTEVAPSEPSAGFKRAMEQLELQRMMEQLWQRRTVTTDRVSITANELLKLQDALIYGTGVSMTIAEPDIGLSYTSTLLPADSVIVSVGIAEDGSLACYGADGEEIKG